MHLNQKPPFCEKDSYANQSDPLSFSYPDLSDSCQNQWSGKAEAIGQEALETGSIAPCISVNPQLSFDAKFYKGSFCCTCAASCCCMPTDGDSKNVCKSVPWQLTVMRPFLFLFGNDRSEKSFWNLWGATHVDEKPKYKYSSSQQGSTLMSWELGFSSSILSISGCLVQLQQVCVCIPEIDLTGKNIKLLLAVSSCKYCPSWIL